jgi:hypothetical protein
MSSESPVPDISKMNVLRLETLHWPRKRFNGIAPKSSEARSFLHEQWAKVTKRHCYNSSLCATPSQPKNPWYTSPSVSGVSNCCRVHEMLRTRNSAQYSGKDYIENDPQLSFFVHHFFQVATHAIGDKSKLHDNVTSLMMLRVADVFREFIPQEGRAESDKLAKTCVYWLEIGQVRDCKIVLITERSFRRNYVHSPPRKDSSNIFWL